MFNFIFSLFSFFSRKKDFELPDVYSRLNPVSGSGVVSGLHSKVRI